MSYPCALGEASPVVKAFVGSIQFGVVGALFGVAYAAICHADKKVAVLAFAIRGAALPIIMVALASATGGSEGKKAKLFYHLCALSFAVVDTIFILAARRLNLIGKTGTIVLGTIAALACAYNLVEARN